MKIRLILLLSLLCFPLYLQAENEVALLEQAAAMRPVRALPNSHEFRGWEYLAGRLYQEGMRIEDIRKIYTTSKMPRFTKVKFSVDPKEPRSMYRGFQNKSNVRAAEKYIRKYSTTFNDVEQTYEVPSTVIVSIILVETHLGKNTGNHHIVYRLSRLANISDPKNLKYNYEKAKRDDPDVTFQDVLKRAHYLENTFLPEIISLIDITKITGYNVFHIKGSSAGAFGIPQFLPSSYLKYGVDYNKDGKVSLYDEQDAIASVGNYLHQHGWNKIPNESVIWKYNKSQAYIDTVLGLARQLTP